MSSLSFSVYRHHHATREQTALKPISQPLKSLIELVLLSSQQHEDYTTGCSILRIIQECAAAELEESKEKFFTKLIQEGRCYLSETMTKLLEIHERGLMISFFYCVNTKKTAYIYSMETLLKIVDDFHQIARLESPIPGLLSQNRLSYDEGGQAYLEQLKQQKREVSKDVMEVKRQTAFSSEPTVVSRAHLLEQDLPFYTLKLAFIRYLSSLPFKHRCTLDIYIKIFNQLQSHAHLSDDGKGALMKLMITVTTREDEPIHHDFTLLEIQDMMDLASYVYQKGGKEFFLILRCKLERDEKLSPALLTRFFNLLKTVEKDSKLLDNLHLQKFIRGTMNVSNFLQVLEDIAPSSNVKETYEQKEIENLLRRCRGDDPFVTSPIPKNFLDKIQVQYSKIESFCDLWRELRLVQLVALASEIRTQAEHESVDEDDMLKLIAIARLAINIKFQNYAHPTQIITVLGQLCYDRGCLAQVKTGEGKSLIVTILAFVLSLQNKTVHMISSSQSLAIRDQNHFFDFFTAFGVSTSHISVEQPDQHRFQAQILYGTATDFEFAVMREMLHMESLFNQRDHVKSNPRFDYVIIDEVDHLTIDTAGHSARLSYETDISYDWIYGPILHFVRQNIKEKENQLLHQPHTCTLLRNHLEKHKQGKFKPMLSHLSDDQLNAWLVSAYYALYSTEEKRDYIVSSKESMEDLEEKQILIVDAKNTGRILHGSRWSKGIHECVEAKHDIAPRKESLTPVSLSHPVLYQMYSCIYGITGTLGSIAEREGMKKIYNTEYFDIPTHKPCLRVDKPLVILSSEDYWKAIVDRTKEFISSRRPILILAQTIEDSEAIEKLLKKEGISLEMLNEVQQTTEEKVLAKAGLPGAVTVATNTATRGTDIRLQADSELNGGLHTLITFFPETQRVEDQARGRAGRQGQKGSSEIIECIEHVQPVSSLTNGDLKAVAQRLYQKRESQSRLMKHYHYCLADLERYCFSLAKTFFSHLEEFSQMLNQPYPIHRYAKALSSHKFINNKLRDLNCLHPKDRLLAEEALRLLTTKDNTLNRWKLLLEQIGERIKDKVINIWSLSFYEKMEIFLRDSISISDALLQEQLQTITDQIMCSREDVNHVILSTLKRLESAAQEAQTHHQDRLKQEVKRLYDLNQKQWEKFLHPSGSGMIDYLRELTQSPLEGI